MKSIDANFYPGWTRKAITFSIDDGNIPMDTKFLSLVRPAGIKGTFNLCSPTRLSPDNYREMYAGYEIANHCNLHPLAFTAERDPVIQTEHFDLETADPQYAYPLGTPGLYRFYTWEWKYLADNETYLALTRDCTRDLDLIFGAGTVKDFVWPFGEQNNPALMQALIDMGFRSIRATGDTRDKDGFAIPRDRMHWSYNAHHKTLSEISALYEAYPDDGELKFFCFGVHSIDFERDNNWEDLAAFCAHFGNRPHDYWYAGVGEIFAYEDAIKAVTVCNGLVQNNSALDLYLKLDGKPVVLKAYSSFSI